MIASLNIIDVSRCRAFFYFFDMQSSSAHNAHSMSRLCRDDVANFLRDYRTALFQIARTKSSNDPPARKEEAAQYSLASRFATQRVREQREIYIMWKKDLRADEMTFIILRGRGHRSTMFLLGWEGISLAERCWIRI